MVSSKKTKKSFFEISLEKPKTYYTYIILFFLCLYISLSYYITSCSIAFATFLLIYIGQERKLTYWDLRRPKPMQVVDHAPGEGTSIAVSHTGQFLATSGSDQIVRLWDYATGQMIQKGVGHSGVVHKCAFSPDDRQLVSVGSDGCVFVWNLYA